MTKVLTVLAHEYYSREHNKTYVFGTFSTEDSFHKFISQNQKYKYDEHYKQWSYSSVYCFIGLELVWNELK